MAVISVTEDFTGLASECHSEPDGTITGSGSRYFDVIFDAADIAAERPFLAKSINAVDPSTSVRVPQLGDNHPWEPWTYVIRLRTAVVDESPFVFRVTVEYREIRNPLDEPPIIEWLSASTMEPIDTDITGEIHLITSSHERFDPPIMRRFNDLLLRATYNEADISPLEMNAYREAVNIDLFMGFLPGIAKVKEWTSRRILDISNYFYWTTVVEIQFRETGWKRQYVDEGYREYIGMDSDGKPKYQKFKEDDDDGVSQFVDEPVKLDGFGKKLNDGAAIVRLKFWANPQLPFGQVFQRFA